MALNPTPRVTVLLPVWNGAAYLADALESICAQTLADFELLIVDDGSTDDTPAILERYRSRDPRIRVSRQAHAGLVAALNRGLDLSRGGYIARMDADDVSAPERLAVQVAFMDEHPDVGLCGTWLKLVGGRRIWRYPCDDADVRCALLFETAIAHPTVMFRRSCVLEQNLRYDAAYEHAEDYALWLRCAQQSRFRLANIPRSLHYLRLHVDRVSKQFAGAQQVSSRRLRAEQLGCLGVQADPAVLAVHESVACLPAGRGLLRLRMTRDRVVAAEAWLRQLHAVNERQCAYPRAAFSRALVERWSRVCIASASAGLSPWWQYWRSPLSRMAWPAWRRSVLLTATSLRRRRPAGC